MGRAIRAADNRISDGYFLYAYDACGRLAQATNALTAAHYRYLVNGLGQRVAKADPGGDGSPVQETVWLGATLVAIIQPHCVYYVFADPLGPPAP